jgi:hypothetical protein
VKPQKGKQKSHEPHPVDSDALSERNPNNDEHHAEGANMRTNEEHNSRSSEPESLAPVQVSLMSISIISIADPT